MTKNHISNNILEVEKKKALIIVDMQNDFLPGGSLAVEGGDEIITFINRIQPDFDVVVATQDWHPAGHYSFASSHNGRKPFDQVDFDGVKQVLWPDHCVQGTPGAEISSQIDMNHICAVFRKGMDPKVDSYSGFFDNIKTHKTGMAGYLRELEITDIYVTGLAADYCVYYTARDGQELGFQTHFIANGTRAISEENYAFAMKDLTSKGVTICRL